MATFVLTDAHISIAGVTLSDHGNQVTISYEAETQDDTVFGDGTRSEVGGLKNWSVEIQFLQDYASGSVDATLFPIVGSAVSWEVRPTSAARSATNPGYNATGVVKSYQPLGQSVGDLAAATVSLVPGGSAPTLLRSTA
ncbi:MAG: radical SAM protein [Actinomycetota bacterium]|nr:radical SAM protein [Actinomycetota bacterium]